MLVLFADDDNLAVLGVGLQEGESVTECNGRKLFWGVAEILLKGWRANVVLWW